MSTLDYTKTGKKPFERQGCEFYIGVFYPRSVLTVLGCPQIWAGLKYIKKEVRTVRTVRTPNSNEKLKKK